MKYQNEKISTNHKLKIIKLGKFLYDKGCIVATDGNISVRINSKEILITRTGVCKGEMKIKDIVRININDSKYVGQALNSVQGSLANSLSNPKGSPYKPSSEYQFHLEIYKNRPDINAVIHAHPQYSTVFAVMSKKSFKTTDFTDSHRFFLNPSNRSNPWLKLNVKLLTETEETLGEIATIGYYKPGSIELAKAVGKTAVKHNAIILAHHGVVVLGKDLTEARYRLERLEFLAKVSLFSSL